MQVAVQYVWAKSPALLLSGEARRLGTVGFWVPGCSRAAAWAHVQLSMYMP